MGHITIRIEINDGVTKSITDLTHYDEPDCPADFNNILSCILDDFDIDIDAIKRMQNKLNPKRH
jgi:hypothetical protein